MEIREEKEITEVRKVVVARACDVCGKKHQGRFTPDDWHLFNHHHNEWGADSVDSYEYHEVCSVKCYASKFNECVQDLENRRDAKVDDFEIQFARILNEKLNS